ncbi:putative non-specific serine/threonine protein kinase [Medicago truncatula]|uniref:Putative non-specific serine/threonine protein kinase n=1 Tax=Medicago truncatula TaxID=3880 RepID=A0A396JFM3_MEDTR|nr:putative non-specific serine/threonine protein kinase [Medicago truncatula]
MGTNFLWFLSYVVVGLSISTLLIMSKLCLCDIQYIGTISPGMEGSQANFIDEGSKFLVSKNRNFAFGFVTTVNDTTKFLLVIVHAASSTVLWTANRALPVSNYDNFEFDKKGNAYLLKDGTVIWSTNTISKTMELQNTGNLVLLGKDDNNTVIWQSFSYPTDTLMHSQDFKEGMKLTSEPSSNNLTYVLEIKSGDVVLSAGFKTPQTYWTMQNDNRINASWIAVLGKDGVIIFSNLNGGGSNGDSSTRIPQDHCDTPEPCDPYNICANNRRCSCPSVLHHRSCKPGFVSPCVDDKSEKSIEFLKADDGLSYFALDFLHPSLNTDLAGCQTSCRGNCSCLAMFFHTSSGNCFLLDGVGSFQKSDDADSGYVSYIKVSSHGSGSANKHIIIVPVVVVIITLLLLLSVVILYCRKKKNLPAENSEKTISWRI